MAGGASMYHTIAHMRETIHEKNFRAKVTDVTSELGVLSVQGQWSSGAKFIGLLDSQELPYQM